MDNPKCVQHSSIENAIDIGGVSCFAEQKFRNEILFVYYII